MKYKDFIAQRKDQIPEIAFNLFAEHGIERVRMQDIADAAEIGVASLYRYYGSKLKLVVEIAIIKWHQFAETIRETFNIAGEKNITAKEEFEYYFDSYIELYKHHKPLLKFNAYFDLYIIHENATTEDLAPYYESIKFFKNKFHNAYSKALIDNSIRGDIPEQELYFGIIHSMLSSATKFAFGIVYPTDKGFDYIAALELQKKVFMAFMTKGIPPIK